MPIGKNSLKRVGNNGYSNVKTTAPDMENSEIKEEIKSPKESNKVAAKKPASSTNKKTSATNGNTLKAPASKAPKATQKKKPVSEDSKSAKASAAAQSSNKENKYEKISVGMDMPDYLL